MTKEEILAQLKDNYGVDDLDSLADLIVRESHEEGDPSKPLANGVIIYSHGLVKH